MKEKNKIMEIKNTFKSDSPKIEKESVILNLDNKIYYEYDGKNWKIIGKSKVNHKNFIGSFY